MFFVRVPISTRCFGVGLSLADGATGKDFASIAFRTWTDHVKEKQCVSRLCRKMIRSVRSGSIKRSAE